MTIQLSITTDYVKDRECPEPFLRAIAEAGFTHLHWCHHWNTDFLYSDSEVEQIGKWLSEFNLKLNDCHASVGREKHWLSELNYERQAGLELIRNRISMTSRLGGDVIILHVPAIQEDQDRENFLKDHLRSALDSLEPFAREHGIRIAAENLVPDSFPRLDSLLDSYSPDFLGVCYDSGHGNICGNGLDQLDKVKHRLISLHLNDNDASGDLHQPLFQGSVDWERLADIIARSSYKKVTSMEVVQRNSGIEDEVEFLNEARRTGERFDQMIRLRENR
ncbi:MAG: sugar phosphate isomerase/epimerase family protein [Planctomycetota bacterium]|jgi:sugar phosphate isomerase/epimerase|nr:sugar phosphate isomerase/epimerase family protein [Planctomycetota bacterium]